MIRNILAGAVAVLVGAAVVHAGPKEDVQAAAKKLGESENYSWTSTVEGGFGGKTEGKTQKDGLTMLALAMRDTTVDVVFKDGKGAIKTQEGWVSLADATGENAPQGPGRFIARRVQNFKSPAKEAEETAGKVAEMQKADDAYTANLSEEAAKEMMMFGRRGGNNGPQVSGAKGTAKFWVKDGVLTKAQYQVEGKVNFNGEDRDINRTTTIEIKDVGSTKIEVPADAKAKMQ